MPVGNPQHHPFLEARPPRPPGPCSHRRTRDPSGQLLAEAILGSHSVPRTLIIDANGPAVVMEG